MQNIDVHPTWHLGLKIRERDTLLCESMAHENGAQRRERSATVGKGSTQKRLQGAGEASPEC
jgi:hypothetical protein